MMDKFKYANMIKSTKPTNRELFIVDKCQDKVVLDLGCIRHSAEFALKDANWLHKKIKAVAKRIVGVDCLPDEIAKINAHGYNVIFADVTKPLNLAERFDVIVAGDLLEHLANFEGFFSNCRALLKPGGELIITTPNPFYRDEFHYLAFKNSFIVNPEHTCWIDPQCLSQLSDRFGFKIEEIAYIKVSWLLKELICESSAHSYDIINGKWENDTGPFRIKRIIVGYLFGIFYFFYKIITGGNSKLCRYSDYLAVLRIGNHE